MDHAFKVVDQFILDLESGKRTCKATLFTDEQYSPGEEVAFVGWDFYLNAPTGKTLDTLIGLVDTLKINQTTVYLLSIIIQGYVRIPEHEYERLTDDASFLKKLHAAGVENWEGYKECLEED